MHVSTKQPQLGTSRARTQIIGGNGAPRPPIKLWTIFHAHFHIEPCTLYGARFGAPQGGGGHVDGISASERGLTGVIRIRGRSWYISYTALVGQRGPKYLESGLPTNGPLLHPDPDACSDDYGEENCSSRHLWEVGKEVADAAQSRSTVALGTGKREHQPTSYYWYYVCYRWKLFFKS